MTTNLEQLQSDVALELHNIKYDWRDTERNLRLVDEIRNSIETLNFDDNVVPSAAHIAEVAVACKNFFHLRDFLMGVRTEKHPAQVALYLNLLKDTLDDEHAVPFATVLSSYLYQFDMREEAQKELSIALAIDPDYSLAMLLKRVYDAQWPSSMMEQMAEDLHANVLEAIKTAAEAE